MKHSDIYILIVDDNPTNLQLVGQILKKQGFQISVAKDGQTALNQLAGNVFHLVLLDVMMPEMDGIETCKRIKSNEKLKDIPIIFLTARTHPEDIVEGFDAGGVDYITKPFNEAELLARVKTHLDLFFSKKKIVELNKNRDFIYSIIAHDIKRPFNKISQLISFLKEGDLSPDSNDFHDLLGLLEKHNSATMQLIENLLDWTSILKSDSLKIEENNVYDAVGYAVAFHMQNAKEKNIEIINKIPEESTALFESNSFGTIMRNLIDNAIKFTPENGTITLDVRDSGTKTMVFITDTGTGMKEEVIDKILHKNEYYTSPGTKSEAGTGIGLQIVKDLIRKNNGMLKIESELLKGSTFAVLLNNQ